MNKEFYDIVIIDSGVNRLHDKFTGKTIEGLSITEDEVINDNFDDKIGHGTAIYHIISRII